VGKPEKVRTAACLVAPLRPCVAGGQTGCGCLFRALFLWLLSFERAKESDNKPKKDRGCPFETPSFIIKIVSS